MDCIHMKGGCKVLMNQKCDTCKFVLTADQAVIKLKKRNERLSSLSAKKQKEIAEKYYSGVMVWQM